MHIERLLTPKLDEMSTHRRVLLGGAVRTHVPFKAAPGRLGVGRPIFQLTTLHVTLFHSLQLPRAARLIRFIGAIFITRLAGGLATNCAVRYRHLWSGRMMIVGVERCAVPPMLLDYHVGPLAVAGLVCAAATSCYHLQFRARARRDYC